MPHRYMLAGTSHSPYGPGGGSGGSGEYGLGSGSAGGGLRRDNTLGADLPSFGIQEGKVRIDAPVIPFLGGLIGAIALGSAKGGYGYVIGGVGGYFLSKLAVIGAKGQNVAANL